MYCIKKQPSSLSYHAMLSLFNSFHPNTDERYTIDPAVGLRIKMITEDDNGNYECRAEVAATGRFDKRDISVVVHSKYTSYGRKRD